MGATRLGLELGEGFSSNALPKAIILIHDNTLLLLAYIFILDTNIAVDGYRLVIELAALSEPLPGPPSQSSPSRTWAISSHEILQPSVNFLFACEPMKTRQQVNIAYSELIFGIGFGCGSGSGVVCHGCDASAQIPR